MPESAKMVIANRLRDGFTVFRADTGAWVESILEGAVARSAEEAQGLLAGAESDAAANVVVGPYLIDITEAGGGRRPVSWREAIRAFGPTVETAAG